MATKLTTNKAFTLIELVMVLVIIGILSVFATGFITLPVQGFKDVLDRSEITNSADLIFTRMTRDLRRALPNTVRVKPNNPKAIEYTNVVKGYRYRSANAPGEDIPDNILLIQDGPDTAFNIMGTFPDFMLGNQGYRVVIFNPGEEGVNSDDPIPGTNVYSPDTAIGDDPIPVAGAHVITPESMDVTLSNIGNEGRVTLSDSMQFSYSHPVQRTYFVDGPVSYIFDDVAGTLTRYSGYSFSAVQPVDPTAAPLNSAKSVAIVATGVSNCSFNYDRNLSLGYGIVKIEVEFMQDDEVITLFDQVYVSNVP